MSTDLTALSEEDLQRQVADVRARMRPVEQRLAELRAERDVLLTEVRRRDRLARRERRAGVKEAMKAGEFPTFEQFLAFVAADPSAGTGSFDDYSYYLKTGGEVRLGFPGARQQSVAFTDGRDIVRAGSLAEAAQRYAAGWEPGSPGRPGVRVHLAGTRQERLVDPADLFVRPGPDG